MTEELQRWSAAISAAADAYDADIYFYSGGIYDAGLGGLISEVAKHKQRNNALLILVTNGGLANVGYQIARLFQKAYGNNFTIFCPSRCKSAGTLVALGASKIIMDQFSELGPLDVQLFKQNEIMSRKSGLLARSSFDALADAAFELYERLMIGITLKSQGNVNFQLASDVSAKMSAKMMSGVYSQINPDIVGSEKRDLEVAKAYGDRLIVCSENASSETVHALVYNYPSHDFIIDDDEARELFINVEFPNDALYEVVGFLGEAAYGEATPTIAVALTRREQEEATDDVNHDGEAEDGTAGSEGSVDDGGGQDRPSNPEASGPGDSGSGGGVAQNENNARPAEVHSIGVLKQHSN